MTASDPRAALLAVAEAPAGDVAAGALWTAADDCEGVDVEGDLGVLDDLGAEVRARLGSGGGAPDVVLVRALATTLADRLHLRGGDGADPRHHYLHAVIRRGIGIPIACSVLWVGVGRRAGLPVEGVGLPGHFVVRVGDTLVDAHAGGETLDRQAARALVTSATGGVARELRAEWLEPVPAREVLARVSRNLRSCHAAGDRWALALRAADRCVALLPGAPEERRERGLLRLRVGLTWPALTDLRAYLAAAEGAPDREDVEKLVVRALAVLN